MQEKIEALRRLLAEPARRIAVVTHTNPDGDAIGSSLALCRLFEELGHRATCIVPNRFPGFLSWMPDIERVVIFKEHPEETARLIEEADLLVCADLNQISRLEALSEAIATNTKAPRILVDHHLNPPDEYDLAFSYPNVSSTALIVYHIIERLAGIEIIDQNIATNLFVGLMTDTGNFTFSYLTPDLYRTVAVLLEKGLDIPYVNVQIYNSYSEGRVRLLGYALGRKMTLLQNGTAAYIALKESELRRFDFQVGDSEGFVNYPLSIKGVKMSALFIQTRRFIRVSLRSRGEVDVNVFARTYFNGGGHRNAAGGKSFVSIEETVDFYKRAVKEFFAGKR